MPRPIVRSEASSSFWFPSILLTGILGWPASIHSQSPSPSLSTHTTNVIVPALVRDTSGKVVYTLQADDFALTDDGVPQKLTLQNETGGEPLALVIAIEVGGAGARQFQNYQRLVPPLAPMLPSIVGNVAHQVAVVTFDSHPEVVQAFTPDLDQAQATLREIKGRDEPPNTKTTGDKALLSWTRLHSQ